MRQHLPFNFGDCIVDASIIFLILAYFLILYLYRISAQEADDLLAVPDKFGMQRREEYEKKQSPVEAVKASAYGLASFNAF